MASQEYTLRFRVSWWVHPLLRFTVIICFLATAVATRLFSFAFDYGVKPDVKP